MDSFPVPSIVFFSEFRFKMTSDIFKCRKSWEREQIYKLFWGLSHYSPPPPPRLVSKKIAPQSMVTLYMLFQPFDYTCDYIWVQSFPIYVFLMSTILTKIIGAIRNQLTDDIKSTRWGSLNWYSINIQFMKRKSSI